MPSSQNCWHSIRTDSRNLQQRIMAKTKATTEQALERMKAAGSRLASSIAATNDDFRFAPLRWWRERWHDREYQRLFIENFIYIRDAFDENKLTLFRFNEIQ